MRHSPDGRLLAVSLLDSTIKVFFEDTLKFFLSLYGHKLPVCDHYVICMDWNVNITLILCLPDSGYSVLQAMTIDISSDSTMLISGSADKNIKIW